MPTLLQQAASAVLRWHLRQRWRQLCEQAHTVAQRIGDDAAHLIELRDERDRVRKRLDDATLAAERAAILKEMAR